VSVARGITDHIDSLPVGSFVRASDFGGSRGAVDTALFRIEASRPDFIRVARGLYWKGNDSRFGAGKPAVVDVAEAAVGRNAGFGPTTWLATNTLEASTQIPAIPEFVVVGAPPERVENARFHRRSNRNRLPLRFSEIALLEVLRDWPRFGEIGWDALVGVVENLVADGSIRFGPTAAAIATEHSSSARANFSLLAGALKGSVEASVA